MRIKFLHIWPVKCSTEQNRSQESLLKITDSALSLNLSQILSNKIHKFLWAKWVKFQINAIIMNFTNLAKKTADLIYSL